MSELQRLIFKDILPDDIIAKLANVSNLGNYSFFIVTLQAMMMKSWTRMMMTTLNHRMPPSLKIKETKENMERESKMGEMGGTAKVWIISPNQEAVSLMRMKKTNIRMILAFRRKVKMKERRMHLRFKVIQSALVYVLELLNKALSKKLEMTEFDSKTLFMKKIQMHTKE